MLSYHMAFGNAESSCKCRKRSRKEIFYGITSIWGLQIYAEPSIVARVPEQVIPATRNRSLPGHAKKRRRHE